MRPESVWGLEFMSLEVSYIDDLLSRREHLWPALQPTLLLLRELRAALEEKEALLPLSPAELRAWQICRVMGSGFQIRELRDTDPAAVAATAAFAHEACLLKLERLLKEALAGRAQRVVFGEVLRLPLPFRSWVLTGAAIRFEALAAERALLDQLAVQRADFDLPMPAARREAWQREQALAALAATATPVELLGRLLAHTEPVLRLELRRWGNKCPDERELRLPVQHRAAAQPVAAERLTHWRRCFGLGIGPLLELYRYCDGAELFCGEQPFLRLLPEAQWWAEGERVQARFAAAAREPALRLGRTVAFARNGESGTWLFCCDSGAVIGADLGPGLPPRRFASLGEFFAALLLAAPYVLASPNSVPAEEGHMWNGRVRGYEYAGLEPRGVSMG